jgi:Rhs element Vgr protein
VSFKIKAADKALDDTYQVLSIDTWLAVNKVPRARVILYDGSPAEQDFPISDTPTFVPGVEVEIAVGYDGKDKTIFQGIILRHAVEIDEHAGSKLVIDLADKAVKMTVARNTAVFSDSEDSKAISQIIGGAGLSKDVEATTVKHEKLIQYYATDWDFIVARAEVCAQIVTTAAGKVTVKKPDVSQEPVLSLEYGDSILSLQAEVDATDQLATSSVHSYAWDPVTQALLDGQGSASVEGAGNLSPATLAKSLAVAAVPQQSGGFLTQAELKEWSTAKLQRSQLAKIRGHVRFQGNALPQVGKMVKLTGVGKRFNGAVFVSGVHHSVRDGTWITTLTFGLSALAFAEAARTIAAPDSSGQLPPMQGLQTGIVKKVAVDPAGALRVLVTLPLLREDTGVWARLGGLYASKGFGAVFYPEVGDEVVLGFMNEDPRFPVIVGSLYSKGRAPSLQLEEANDHKGIVTRSKLELTFDDKDKIVVIKTPGGHSITLSDKDQSVAVKDSNGNSMTMSSSGIELKSAKDVTISAAGAVSITANQNISISSSGGDASMSALNVKHAAQVQFSANGNASAELTASGTTTVKGALVMIN